MFLRYIGKRVLQTLIVLFFVSIFAFLLIRMASGNPARMMLPDDATEEQVQQMEIKLGLDKPLYQQYFMYMSGVLRGDLGTSTIYKQAVSKIIASRMPVTGKLTFWTIVVCLAVSIPLGVVAGSKQGTVTDFMAMFFAIFGQSMSPVWLGILLIYVFSSKLGWLPAMGYGGIKYVILPAITLGYPVAAEITRIGRSGMIDVLKEDYITATYAKGMSRKQVLWKYAFKNALIPIITLVGVQIGVFLAGTVVVETIFSWSGLGQLVYQAVSTRDYSLVQSSLLIAAAAVLLQVLLGTALGIIAGYIGGAVDKVIMRACDVFLALPNIILAIAVMAVMGTSVFNLIAVLTISGWVRYCKVVRNNVMVVKKQEFVSASKVLGASNLHIMFTQILPNVTTPIIILASSRFGNAILVEATLSFLNLGIPAPTPSWGNMIADGRQYLATSPWLVLAPGIALMITVLAFNFLGDGLRDVLDPKKV